MYAIPKSVTVFFVLALLGCSGANFLQHNVRPEMVAGTYQTCGMQCTTIDLLQNGEFSYQTSDCLTPNIHAHGRWHVSRDGIVVLNSEKKPKVNESSAGLEGVIRIKGIDYKGTPMPTLIEISCNEMDDNIRTVFYDPYRANDPSVALEYVVVRGCTPKSFSVYGFSLRLYSYAPKHPDSDTFEFETWFDTELLFQDEVYLWRRGELFDLYRSKSGFSRSKYSYHRIGRNRKPDHGENSE